MNFSLRNEMFFNKVNVAGVYTRRKQPAIHRKRNRTIAFRSIAGRQTRRNNGKSKGGSMAGRYTQGTRSPEPCLRSRWPFLRTRNCTEYVVAHPGLREPSVGSRRTIKLHLNNVAETGESNGREKDDDAGHTRSKLHRYGKRLGQVVTVTMVFPPPIVVVTSKPLYGYISLPMITVCSIASRVLLS